MAVVAVIGAAFTGGASVVALAPALGLLATDVYTALPGVRGVLLLPDQAEKDAVKKSYADAKKDFDEVVSAGKEVISFVGMIEKLSADASSDKYVALVKRGAEAAYAVLLADLHKQQQGLTTLAARARLSGANHDLQLARGQLADLRAAITN